ncbi:hypothetical protein MKEN_00375100 [Mycena kentingensis (nom. inval.)]|nr:hypothetical protein MKEN_00375100 [Mycena kentingensis (nom. inval.)]
MAPPVVVYVVAAVAAVGAVVAFKEFVYEPHLAPKIERWAEGFLAKRKAAKERKLKAKKQAVPVAASQAEDVAASMSSLNNQSTYELETLVANEVTEWRNQIDVARAEGMSTLRQRRPVSMPLDESNIIIPYDPITPTHVLFDDGLSVISTTSTMSSRVPTPLDNSHSTLSHQSFRAPPPPNNVQAPPTPDPSVRAPSPVLSRAPSAAGSAAGSGSNPFISPSDPEPLTMSYPSPHQVPSLSLSHRVDLDADVELLSAPSSSRPVSPSAFSESAFSQTDEQAFHSFTMSPSPMQPPTRSLSSFPTSPMTLSPQHISSGSELGVSDTDDDELERWSNAGSDIIGSESSWASAGVRSR